MSYLVMDEQGIYQVKCMKCGVVVRERRGDILRTLSNYAEEEAYLEQDGKPHSVMTVILCKEDVGSDIDFDMVMDGVKDGWSKEMVHDRQSQKEIDKALKRFEKVKIKKKVGKEAK